MALKSREWFFGECYKHVKRGSPLQALADRALELGFRREMTGGHILQACGAAQVFLEKYPQHRQTIKQAPVVQRYRLKGQVLKDWLELFGTKQGTYGRKEFQYSWNSLRTYLTAKYGGIHRGGGGGNDKLELVLRLVAEF